MTNTVVVVVDSRSIKVVSEEAIKKGENDLKLLLFTRDIIFIIIFFIVMMMVNKHNYCVVVVVMLVALSCCRGKSFWQCCDVRG